VVAFQQLIDTTSQISKARDGLTDTIQEVGAMLKKALKEKTHVHKQCLEFLSSYSEKIITSYDELEQVRRMQL
jgi:nitrate reductase assembly molybdenum cofactor insertion protein NarJ